MRLKIRLVSSLALISVGFLTLLAGCSGGSPATAKVSGKVTFDGQPVTSGSLTFAPIASSGAVGKPASGAVQADGTFTLTTYAVGDGAVVGKHRVVYSPGGGDAVQEAPSDSGEHSADAPPPAFSGLVPKAAEVEVVAGGNEIEIELVKSGDAAQ